MQQGKDYLNEYKNDENDLLLFLNDISSSKISPKFVSLKSIIHWYDKSTKTYSQSTRYFIKDEYCRILRNHTKEKDASRSINSKPRHLSNDYEKSILNSLQLLETKVSINENEDIIDCYDSFFSIFDSLESVLVDERLERLHNIKHKAEKNYYDLCAFLYGTCYRYHEPEYYKSDDYASSIWNDNLNEIDEYIIDSDQQSYNAANYKLFALLFSDENNCLNDYSFESLERFLRWIPEDSEPGSAIIGYVNKVFCGVLGHWIIKWWDSLIQRNLMSRKEIFQFHIFPALLNVKKDKYEDYYYNSLQQGTKCTTDNSLPMYKEFVSLFGANYNPVNNIKEVYEFIIKKGDIQFWIGISNNIGLFDTKSQMDEDPLNIRLEMNELNNLRNRAAHIGSSIIGIEHVYRTLKTIVICFRKMKLNQQASLLEKRVFYYRYILYGTRNVPIDGLSFGNLNYNACEFKAVKVSSWLTTTKISIADISNTTWAKEDQCLNLIERARKTYQILFNRDKHTESEIQAISCIYNYYMEQGVLFPPFVFDSMFKELLENGYPFSPTFFLQTKGLAFEDVLTLACECVAKGILSQSEDILILPYSIDFNSKSIVDHLVDYFATGYNIDLESIVDANQYFDVEVKKKPNPHYWKVFQETEIDRTLVEERKKKIRIPSLYKEVAKSFVLLGLTQLCGYPPILHNRDWVRLFCCQPGKPVGEVEEAIDYLHHYSEFLNGSDHYSFIRPLSLKSTIDELNKYVRQMTYLSIGKESKDVIMGEDPDCIFNNLYEEARRLLSQNDQYLPSFVEKTAMQYAKEQFLCMKEEAHYCLSFITYLRTIWMNKHEKENRQLNEFE